MIFGQALDKNRDNQPGMIGMLALVAIQFFYSRCVKLIEKVTVNKTLVIVWKQIKKVAGGK
jgi:hypothetical protein